MRMVITTEYEEGAHHVSDDLYKAIMLVLLDNKSFPLVSSTTTSSARNSEADIALAEFKKICPPFDENNLDREWLEMFGFFWKGWQAKAVNKAY